MTPGDPKSDPTADDLTKSQRDNRIKKLKRECERIIADPIARALETALAETSPTQEPAKVEIAKTEKGKPETILVHYPRAIDSPMDGYNAPSVKVELSPKAEGEPTQSCQISPYVVNEFPKAIKNGKITVETVLPTRTFWEKAALIHEENTRDRAVSPRLSRHYYDLYQLILNGHTDISLFQKVLEHRKVFFDAKWVEYDQLSPTTLVLCPPDEKLNEWQQDYRSMKEVFFGSPPSFEEVASFIRKFQAGLTSKEHDSDFVEIIRTLDEELGRNARPKEVLKRLRIEPFKNKNGVTTVHFAGKEMSLAAFGSKVRSRRKKYSQPELF